MRFDRSVIRLILSIVLLGAVGGFVAVEGAIGQSVPISQSPNAEKTTEADRLLKEGNRLIGEKQYPAALESFQKALVIYREIRNSTGIGDAENGIGNTRYWMGSYQLALEGYERSLTAYQSVNNQESIAQASMNIGETHLKLKQYPQSIEAFQKALPIYTELKNDNASGNAQNLIGVSYYRAEQYMQAIESFNKSLIHYKTANGKTASIAQVLKNLGDSYYYLKDYQKSLLSYQDALTVYEKIGDSKNILNILKEIGSTYRKLKQFDKALQSYEQALEFYQKTEKDTQSSSYLEIMGELYNLIGVTYYSLKQYPKAIDSSQNSLKFYQQGKPLPRKIAQVLSNLGDGYWENEQLVQALESYEQSLLIYKQLNDRHSILRINKDISTLYRRQKKPEQAIKRYEQAIEIYLEGKTVPVSSEDFQAIAEIYNRIGVIYEIDLKNRSIGISNFQKALGFYQKGNAAPTDIAQTFSNLGNSFYAAKNYDQAIEFYQKALLLYRQSGSTDEAKILGYLSQAYRQLGQEEKAIDYHKQSLQKNRSDIKLGIDKNVSSSQEVDLTGVWQIQSGKSTDRNSYTGKMMVSRTQDRYNLRWETSNGLRSGIGIVEDGKLFAAWIKGGDVMNGLVLYQIRNNGSLNGQWFDGVNVTGTEDATGGTPGILEGNYKVSGKNYNGSTYKGKLQVQKIGETYQLIWDTGTEYRGVGIRVGDYFVVGWGSSELPNVAAYEVKGDRLIGQLATLGQPKLMYETLSFNSNGTNQNQQKLKVTQLQSEANSLYQEGERKLSIQKLQEALLIVQKIEDPSLEANILRNIGDVYYNQEQFTQALKYFELSLNIYQKLRSQDDVFWILALMGSIYRSQGNYLQALSNYQQALTLSAGKQGSEEGRMLNQMGLVYVNQGEYAKALPMFEKALAIYRNQDFRLGEGMALENMGYAYAEKGVYSKALTFYEQALTIHEKSGNSSGKGNTQGKLANLYASQGNYTKALEIYDESLVTIRSRLQKNKQAESSVFLGMGKVYENLGLTQKSLELYQQALSTYQELGYQASAGTTLSLIGETYANLKQYSKSFDYYQKSLTIARSIGDVSGESSTLRGLGRLYIQQNQPQKAMEVLQKSLNIQKQIGARPQEVSTLNVLGRAQMQLTQLAEAQANLQSAVALSQELGDISTQAQALSNLGQLFNNQNKPQLAIVLYKQSVIQYETIRKGLAPLPKDQQESYTQTVAQTYRNLADLLIQQNRLLEAQQILDLLKLQEIKDYAPITRNAVHQTEIQLTETEQKIAQQYSSLLNFRQKLDQCNGKLNDNDCDKLQQDQRQQSKAFDRFLDALKTEVRDRCKNQNEETCILPGDQFTTAANKMIKAQPGSIVILPVVLEKNIWILVISESGIITRYESKVDRLALGNKVLELRKQLNSPNSDLTQLQATSKQLYDWLIKPIEPTIQASKTSPKLIFALDRVTRYIPMGVLHDGQRYLTQRYPISTVLSLETTNTDKSTIGDIQNTNILALGLSNPVASFNALPAVESELASIIQSSGIYPGIPLLNQNFTFSNMVNNFQNKKILHIATHGKFDPIQKNGSFLVLGNGDKLPIDDIRTLKDSHNLELVVLSACQTALGNAEQEGTEIPGISSYFLTNGVATVMASLWSVDDASTALLMKGFYRYLSQGKTKSEALQQTQLDLLKLDNPKATQAAIDSLPRFTPLSQEPQSPERSSTSPGYIHPYYWAPFILIGNSQ